jgi:hypothetical protein
MKQFLFLCVTTLFLVASGNAEENKAAARLDPVKKTEVSKEDTSVSGQFLDRAASDYSSYRYQKPTDNSRYSTSQGWSRGRYGFWWGRQGSDIPSSGYTPPASKK